MSSSRAKERVKESPGHWPQPSPSPPKGEREKALAATRSGWLLRRHRIEQREQEQAGNEPADMGFPGDALLGPGQADRTDAEQQVQPEPSQEKNHDAGIAQRKRQRRRGHEISRGVLMAEHGERSTALKCESDRARHETGDCCRGAYHRHQLAPMGNKMRQGTGCRRRPKEADDAQVSKSPRDSAAERQEPNRIHA